MEFSSPPPSPIIAMFEQLLPLFVIVAFLGILARSTRMRPNRKQRGPVRRGAAPSAPPLTPKKSALARAQDGTFARKPLFNRSELKVFGILEDEIRSASLSYRVMGQTSLRGFLTTDDKYETGGSHYAIGERRMDFVVADTGGNVILAVEYNGEGHFLNKSEERDAIKAIALGKAGVALLTIEASEGEALIRQRIRNKLGISEPA